MTRAELRSHLRIAVLATVVEFGGLERVLLTLLQHGQTQFKLSPILFTRTATEQNHFIEKLDMSGISYDRLYVNTSKSKYFNPLRNICETIACLKTGSFDLIHTHGYRADLIGYVASKIVGLPIIATCHGHISTDSNLRLYNKMDICVLRHFDRVIAVSEQLKRELVEQGVGEQRVEVITNAVSEAAKSDPDQVRRKTRSCLGMAQDEFVVGSVGRLSVEKGFQYLLEALKGFTGSENFKWRLVLIGDGPDRATLEQLVRDFGLNGRVHFMGFQGDMADWYPVMDVFVLPSLTEGTPMALLEAMANGVPVIATSVGGVPALITSGENGFLVPPADPLRLRGALQSLALDRALRERLGNNGMQTIQKNHSMDRWITQITEAYVETLRRGRRA